MPSCGLCGEETISYVTCSKCNLSFCLHDDDQDYINAWFTCPICKVITFDISDIIQTLNDVDFKKWMTEYIKRKTHDAQIRIQVMNENYDKFIAACHSRFYVHRARQVWILADELRTAISRLSDKQASLDKQVEDQTAYIRRYYTILEENPDDRSIINNSIQIRPEDDLIRCINMIIGDPDADIPNPGIPVLPIVKEQLTRLKEDIEASHEVVNVRFAGAFIIICEDYQDSDEDIQYITKAIDYHVFPDMFKVKVWVQHIDTLRHILASVQTWDEYILSMTYSIGALEVIAKSYGSPKCKKKIFERFGDMFEPAVTNERVRALGKCRVCDGVIFQSLTSLTCNKCGRVHCQRCYEIQHDGECDQTILREHEEIMRIAKPCPVCGTMIVKVNGTCNDMFCNQCHTGFRYTTGDLIQGSFHNPERQEYVRSLNMEENIADFMDQLAPNVQSDIITTSIRRIRRLFEAYDDFRDVLNEGLVRSMIPPVDNIRSRDYEVNSLSITRSIVKSLLSELVKPVYKSFVRHTDDDAINQEFMNDVLGAISVYMTNLCKLRGVYHDLSLFSSGRLPLQLAKLVKLMIQGPADRLGLTIPAFKVESFHPFISKALYEDLLRIFDAEQHNDPGLTYRMLLEAVAANQGHEITDITLLQIYHTNVYRNIADVDGQPRIVLRDGRTELVTANLARTELTRVIEPHERAVRGRRLPMDFAPEVDVE